MNEEFRTGLINRLASLSPQDFQSVISAATGRRVRTNSRPIPKKLQSKMMTRAKMLKRRKKVKIPFKLEGYFEAELGIDDDNSHYGTDNVTLHTKESMLSGDLQLEHALLDAFWEADESDPSEMKEYHKALSDGSAIYHELYDLAKEACHNYGHDLYDFMEDLFEQAEREAEK